MERADEILIQQIAPSNPELQALVDRHRAFEDQIAELSASRWLSDEDRARLSELKRQKLRGRDRIEAILAAHRGAGRADP